VRTRGLTATYLLALAVPFLESVWPRVELARGSLSALLWLFALALLPYPRAGAEDGEKPLVTTAWLALALLPPLGLTLGLDLARGTIEPARAAWTTLGFAALLAAWTGLAVWAAPNARRRARYRDAWLLVVPGLATLTLALAWVPRGADDGRAARFWALSPLVLAQRAARAGGAGERTGVEFALALAGAALAATFVAGAPREERA
jgi:hypothetical protein